MIPLERLPGFARWGGALEALLARPEALWIHGSPGCGVSTLGRALAAKRGAAFLDDAELLESAAIEVWLRQNPRGVAASHRAPQDGVAASRCIALRLPDLEEDPAAVPSCFAVLAQEEGVARPWPPRLEALPCPGGLRGLRNRLLRWKLLGQLPEDPQAGVSLPLEDENLAANLHALERILLHRVLRRTYGNRVEAAARLGISRRHLYMLIARHGDPVRGDGVTDPGPKRLRRRQNSSPGGSAR